MNIFAPFRIQRSPFRTAVVRRPAASEPEPGSVRPQARELPAGREVRQVLPLQLLRPEAQEVPGAEPVVARDGERERAVEARDLLDHHRRTPSAPSSEPPYASGTFMPSTPSSPSIRTVSRGNSPVSSHRARLRLHLALAEVAHGALEVEVLVGEIEVHGSSHRPSTTRLRRYAQGERLSSYGERTSSPASPLASAPASARTTARNTRTASPARRAARSPGTTASTTSSLASCSDVDVLLGTRRAAAARTRRARASGLLLDLVEVDGVHRRLRAHDRDHGLRQREAGVGLEGGAAHGVEARRRRPSARRRRCFGTVASLTARSSWRRRG